jgi:hypothetical protein
MQCWNKPAFINNSPVHLQKYYFKNCIVDMWNWRRLWAQNFTTLKTETIALVQAHIFERLLGARILEYMDVIGSNMANRLWWTTIRRIFLISPATTVVVMIILEPVNTFKFGMCTGFRLGGPFLYSLYNDLFANLFKSEIEIVRVLRRWIISICQVKIWTFSGKLFITYNFVTEMQWSLFKCPWVH